jgi:hypothetical protein
MVVAGTGEGAVPSGAKRWGSGCRLRVKPTELTRGFNMGLGGQESRVTPGM